MRTKNKKLVIIDYFLVIKWNIRNTIDTYNTSDTQKHLNIKDKNDNITTEKDKIIKR